MTGRMAHYSRQAAGLFIASGRVGKPRFLHRTGRTSQNWIVLRDGQDRGLGERRHSDCQVSQYFARDRSIVQIADDAMTIVSVIVDAVEIFNGRCNREITVIQGIQ